MNAIVRKLLADNKHVFVNPRYDDRSALLLFLGSEGFVCRPGQENSWESIRESVFPIAVDFKNKEYYCLQTVTSAAAALSSGLVVSDRDLYEFFGVPVDMRFEEYRELVKDHFVDCGYSDEEAESYMSESHTLKLLIKGFESYTRFGMAAYAPPALASCLDMLF